MCDQVILEVVGVGNANGVGGVAVRVVLIAGKAIIGVSAALRVVKNLKHSPPQDP